MIGRLRGKLILKHAPLLVLDVHGVGYELEAPMTTFYDLGEVGEEVTLHTHLVVREDAQLLYGFLRHVERDLFRSLLRVTGIGPRVALAILSGLSAEDFLVCVGSEDVAMLTRVPGIGSKTAQRLIVEMRDRVASATLAPAGVGSAGARREVTPLQDAVSALVALGYKPAEAQRAARAVEGQDQGLSSEEIIRRALRSMSAGAA